jgi:hypothetical protein
MHECTSWRALGCMNFGTDPRSIGFDFAAGAFAPPIGFTAGGGGGGHQGFGRTGGFGGGAGGVRFACFADGRGGYFGSGGLDDLEGCEGSGCRRSFGFSTPWIGLKGKQENANTTYAWKKTKRVHACKLQPFLRLHFEDPLVFGDIGHTILGVCMQECRHACMNGQWVHVLCMCLVLARGQSCQRWQHLADVFVLH